MISPNKVASFFMLLALSSFAKAEQPRLTLQVAINIAELDNPSLAQTQARSRAMSAIPSQVGTLPDPVISFTALNLPVDTFDIAQAIPFFGKLALREQAATFQSEAAFYDVTEARFHLLRDVKNTWWALFYLDRALDIIATKECARNNILKQPSLNNEISPLN